MPINAGVWRYHPTRHVFEVFADGTSNPWGLDFDDHGQAFIEACVIPHCFHIIQGGRYQRQAGQHFNPYTYDDIQTIADHRHYGGANPHGGNDRSDAAGGGHAHCGLMIYLGGAWPEEYRGQMFMGNIHGRRLNVDILEAEGLRLRRLARPGLPAGQRRLGAVHQPALRPRRQRLPDRLVRQAGLPRPATPKIWDRTNGRIYKISYRGTKPVTGVDLARMSDEELVELPAATRTTGTSGTRGGSCRSGRRAKRGQGHATPSAGDDRPSSRQGRDATGCAACGRCTSPAGLTTDRYLEDAWPTTSAVSCAAGRFSWRWKTGTARRTTARARWRELARDGSVAGRPALPGVGAAAAAASASAGTSLDGLLAHGEDASDHNLPLMYWYAAEPLAGRGPGPGARPGREGEDAAAARSWSGASASAGTPEAIALLVDHLGRTDDADAAADDPRAASTRRSKGRRQVAMPAGWPAAFAKLRDSKNADVRNAGAGPGRHLRRPAGARPSCGRLLADAKADAAAPRKPRWPSLRRREGPGACRRCCTSWSRDAGAARRRHPRPGRLTTIRRRRTSLLEAYPSLSPAEKRDALNTLAVAAGLRARRCSTRSRRRRSPPADVSADIVRQLRNLQRRRTSNRRIAEVWGVVRDTPADRKAS